MFCRHVSVLWGQVDGTVAETDTTRMLDGNENTYIHRTAVVNAFVQIEYAEPVTVSRAILQGRAYGGYYTYINYALIEYSMDGETWDVAMRVRDNNAIP